MQSDTSQHCCTAIADFLQSLERGLKTSVLYPANSALPKEFKSICWTKLNSILTETESLDFEINREEILSGGESVYSAESGDSSLSGIMHRDGLRRIRFGSSVSEEEFEKFFQALHIAYADRTGAEDVVNILWEMDLDSIEYHAVDDFVISSDLTESFCHMESNKLNYRELIANETADAKSRSEQSASLEQDKDSRNNGGILQMVSDVQEFKPAEKQHIWKAIEDDRSVAIEFSAIDLLFDVAMYEREYTDFKDTCDTLDSSFNQLLANESMPLLVYIMRKFRECIATLGGDSRQRAERVRESYFRCGDRIRISKIAAMLNKSEDQDLDPVRSYLEELDWSALTQLVWLLGELEYFPARKMVCELLVQKGKKRPDIISSAVYDSRWYVARNAASILGKIGSDKCISPLRKAITHDDERVRWEAVSALCEMAQPEAVAGLVEAIDDGSERIRHGAIKRIIDLRHVPAFEKIKSIVEGGAFDALSPIEQREFLKAYAVTGQDRALKQLKKIANAWRPFGGKAAAALKESAVRAIGHCECPEAEEILEKWSRKARGDMKAWALRAIEVRQRRLERTEVPHDD